MKKETAMKKISLFIILILVTSAPAFATVYTVKTSGGDYSTISACATDAQAGDTCEVYDGTYSGTVSPPRDGSSGNWITFKAASGNSPVSGGWRIGGRDYIEINGFTSGAFSGYGVTNIKIMNNAIQNVHDGISLSAAYDVLISGNTFNNMSGDMIRQFGERWTIRNNVIIEETDSQDDHMDLWQSWCEGGVAASYYLIENNSWIHITGGNSHFALINDTTQCNDATSNSIIRYNKVYDVDSMAAYIDENNAEPGGGPNVIYNNTWVVLNGGSPASWKKYAHDYAASDNSTGINNIFYDAVHHSRAEGFNWGSGGAQSYNLYYDPDNTMTFAGLASSETGAVKNQDPLLTNPGNNDFSLQAGSPAIDKGGPLTSVATADTSSGTSLVVEKAEFFQPGWGGADADWIAVGSVSNVAQISSIDYNYNTINLANPILRSDGDPVYLYRDSDGTQVLYGLAPDIGAFEFGMNTIPAPPSGLRIVHN